MNKEKKPRSIEVKERVKLKIGDKEYEFESNTPTTAFYTDLYDEMTLGQDTPVLLPLARMRVFDSAGAVGAEITSENWTLDKTSTSITISGSAIWNSDNPPAKLQLVTPNLVPYFDTPLPAGISAQKGLPISVTWDAVFNVNIPSATGYLAGSTVVYTNYISLLVDILANNRNNRYLSIRSIEYQYTDGTKFDLLIVSDREAHHLYLPPAQVPKPGSINIVMLYTSAGIYLSFILSSPLNVSSGDYVSLDIYLV
jgi:hypothetical protein